MHELAELRGRGHATEDEVRTVERIRVREAKVEGDVTVVDMHFQLAVLLGGVAHDEGVVLVERGTTQVVQVRGIGSDVGWSDEGVPEEERTEGVRVALEHPVEARAHSDCIQYDPCVVVE